MASNNEAKIKFTAETSDFTQAIKDSNQEMSQLRAEMKLADATFKNTGDSAEYQQQKLDLLQAALEANHDKQEALTAKLEAAKDIYGEDSKEVASLEKQLTYAKTEEQNLLNQVNETNDGLDDQSAAADDAGSAVEDMASILVNAEVAGKVKEIAEAALDMAQNFDEAKAALVEGTGASGEALGELQKAAEGAFGRIADADQDLTSISSITAELNTRFGVTGKEAEDMTVQMAKFAKSTGSDGVKAVDGIADIMKRWNLDLKDAGKLLDDLTTANQSCQLSVDDLTGYLTSNSTQFQELGYSTEEALAMLIALSDGGADVGSVMSGLTKGVANLAETTDDVPGSFRKAIDAIGKCDSVSEALQVQVGDTGKTVEQIFGKKAAQELATNVLNGSFAIEEWTAKLGENEGALETTSEGVTTMKDAWAQAVNNVSLALGSTMAPAISNIVKKVAEVITKVAQVVQNSPVLQAVITGVATALGILASALAIGSIISAVTKAFTLLNTALLANPIVLVVTAIAALAAGLVYAYNHCETFRNIVNSAFESIKTVVMPIVTAVKDFAVNAFQAIKGKVDAVMPQIKNVISTVWDTIKNVVSTVVDTIKNVVSNVFNAIKTFISDNQGTIKTIISTIWNAIRNVVMAYVGAIKNFVTTTWDTIKTTVSTVVDGIKTVITSVFGAIKALLKGDMASVKANLSTAWNAIKEIVSSVVEGIKTVIGSYFQGIKTVISSYMSGIKSVVSTVWDAIKGKVTEVLGNIKTAVGTAWNTIKTGISTILTNIKTAVINAWNGIKTSVTTIGSNIKTTVTNAWSALKTSVTNLTTNIKTAVTNAWNGIKTGISNTVTGIVNAAANGFNALKTSVTNLTNNAKTAVTNAWNAIKTGVSNIVTGIVNAVANGFNALKTSVTNLTNAVKNTITTVWSTIKTGVSNTVTGIVNAVANGFSALKTSATNITNGIKTTVTDTWNTIKTGISTAISGAKTAVVDTVNGIKTNVSTAFSALKTSVGTVWNGIKTAITDPINTAKTTISTVLTKIKNLFANCVPKLKISLPHVHVDGGSPPWGIAGKGRLPSFSVTWNKLGAIFGKPTIFATRLGFQGVGENGPEAVAPISTLQEYVEEAVERGAAAPIDYDRLADKVAAACAKMNIRINLDNRQLGRVVREMV